MNRAEALQKLVKHLTNELVISHAGYSCSELYNTKDRPQNIYMSGGMGLAAPIALGMSMAMPDRKVIVFDGDGGLLMGLGTLATIAAEAPANLVHIAWDNGQWAATGGQIIATSRGTSLAKVAEGAGITNSFEVTDLERFEEIILRALAEDGPWFICAKITETRPKRSVPFDIDANVIRFLEKGLA